MGYSVTVLADSVNQVGDRLVTFECSFPRLLLPEIERHRALSLSGASSRAIPVQKFIDQVNNDPFVPVEFGRNQRGMVAGDPLDGTDRDDATTEWLLGRSFAVSSSEELSRIGVHKQVSNRPMEPYMWTTFIISATEWQNFFALRTAPDTQPEFRKLALMMCDSYYFGSTPVERGDNDWHLPLVTQEERGQYYPETLAKVSAARCGSVSYLRQNDERPISAWIELCDDKLVAFQHFSPLEHPAVPAWHSRHGGNCWGNFTGWKQLRKHFPNEVRTFSLDDAKQVLGK